MKTISLRQFSNVVQELVEPVQVAKREKKGVLRILGTWTPVDFRPTATYSTNLGNATNSASTWTHWHPTKPDER